MNGELRNLLAREKRHNICELNKAETELTEHVLFTFLIHFLLLLVLVVLNNKLSPLATSAVVSAWTWGLTGSSDTNTPVDPISPKLNASIIARYGTIDKIPL